MVLLTMFIGIACIGFLLDWLDRCYLHGDGTRLIQHSKIPEGRGGGP